MMDKDYVKDLVQKIYSANNELQNYAVEHGEPLGVDPVRHTSYGREMNVLKIAENINRSNIELLSRNK